MARITIAGDSIVITSSHTLEAIKKIEKYAPRSLKLYELNEDGKPEEVFAVASAKAAGSINQYGASFGSTTHDNAKLATITLPIPANVPDAVQYAAETYGRAVMLLNRVESQFGEALARIDAEMEAILDSISVTA